MSKKIYAKFKNLDIVQWVTGNVYSYQSLSKISKNLRIKKNRENKYLSIMNILEKVLKYHTNSQSQILKEIWYE